MKPGFNEDKLMPETVNLNHVQGLLIDLAGVLYVGDQALPGALDAMKKLRASGLALCFITNTSRTPRDVIVRRLHGMGFQIQVEEVLTAASATRDLVKQRGLRPHYLVHPDIAEEMGGSEASPDVVVLGDAGAHFTYERLNEAFRWLMKGLPLMAMAKNRFFKEPNGLSLDMGAFVAALEFAAGAEAEVVGKPSRAFFETALASLNVAASAALMIGDDLHDDIGGAQRSGIAGALVRTGKYRPEDEHDPAVQPAWVADDFADAVSRLLEVTDS